MSSSENQYGQGKSHASGDSAVPPKLQEKLPKSLEDQAPGSLARCSSRRYPPHSVLLAPESVHPTGSDKGRSHATGKSIVPQKIQEAVPEGLERALPDAIHDTSGLPPKKK